MGLLDDAIREHLDLKRRRGADPAEVSRQEQEALGPVRRDVSEATPVDEAELDEAAPAIAEEEPLLYDDDLDAAPPAEPAEPGAPVGGPYDAAADFGEGPATEYLEPPAANPADDEWGFEDEEEEPAASEESAPAQPDEDVLEETPEFLQESPEHDRLWFEQKPPRDFDFDG